MSLGRGSAPQREDIPVKVTPARTFGFLHNHPGMEARFGLPAEHVIVDRDDWDQAKQRLGLDAAKRPATSNLFAVVDSLNEDGTARLKFQGGRVIELWATQLPEGAGLGDVLRIDVTLEGKLNETESRRS